MPSVLQLASGLVPTLGRALEAVLRLGKTGAQRGWTTGFTHHCGELAFIAQRQRTAGARTAHIARRPC